MFVFFIMAKRYLFTQQKVLLILSFFLLSGCSYTDNFARIQFPLPQNDPPVLQETVQEDPDLALEPAEDEICLTQELEALKQAGTWEHPTSSDWEIAQEDPLYTFPLVHNKQVETYLKLFQGKQRKQFTKWLERSGKYAPVLAQELRKANLPTDLLYLAMIESGFNQRAYSRARAVGLWQFMGATAKQYGLRIDRYVDERRDVEKSTRAAVAYLSDLYEEFGDWHLAVAAYNAGPGRIRKGLRKYKTDNFWDLAQHRHLRLETKRYVPKLIAAIMIAKSPEKYGFYNLAYHKPVHYDLLEVGSGLSFDAIALLSGQTEKDIKALNIELKTAKTPINTKSYLVKIPAGTFQYAKENLKRLHSMVSTGYKIHIYKKGETLSAICRKYNINKTTLLKVNNLTSTSLNSGKRLRIPYTTVTYQLLPKGSDEALAAYKNNLILHTIKRGETISKISKRYNVPPELIVAWNGLTSVHKITAGQQLALYINRQGVMQKDIPSRQQKTAEDNILVLSGNNKRYIEQGEQPGQQISWYRVKRGDSLWTISRKFNISPSQIKQWNNLKSNLIHPGIKLKLINV